MRMIYFHTHGFGSEFQGAYRLRWQRRERLQHRENNNQDGRVGCYRTPFKTNVHRVFQSVVFDTKLDFVSHVTEMYNMYTNSERGMHFCLLCKSA